VAAGAEIPSDASAPKESPSTGADDSGLRLAGLVDSKLTQAGGMMGTPGFMPPEQALGEQLDGRADLYAIGCVAYWLLTGGLVFERMGVNALIIATLQDEPEFSRFASNVPPALTALIASCLSKSPDGRPADARTLMHALKAIRVGPLQAWDEEQAQTFWQQYFPRRARTPASSAAPTQALGEARTLIMRTGNG
jgi:eukaryotic-like serine/threonine-protein kinase